jgi:hypothetical protein
MIRMAEATREGTDVALAMVVIREATRQRLLTLRRSNCIIRQTLFTPRFHTQYAVHQSQSTRR